MALAALGPPAGAPVALLRLHYVPGAPVFAFRANARHLHVATDAGYWVLGSSPHRVAAGAPLCCVATHFENIGNAKIPAGSYNRSRTCVGVVVRDEGLQIVVESAAGEVRVFQHKIRLRGSAGTRASACQCGERVLVVGFWERSPVFVEFTDVDLNGVARVGETPLTSEKGSPNARG